jgi:uncharacterized membrane protein YkvA (DUF1232 family)
VHIVTRQDAPHPTLADGPKPMTRSSLRARLTGWARALKTEIGALAIVARDPRTPWPAKALALATVAYALSPIDLIPDFVPVLGLLDDLILVPAGIWLVLRLVPAEVMAEARNRAREEITFDRTRGRTAAVLIVAVWIASALAVTLWLFS